MGELLGASGGSIDFEAYTCCSYLSCSFLVKRKLFQLVSGVTDLVCSAGALVPNRSEVAMELHGGQKTGEVL